MELKKPFDINKVSIYDLLDLRYPDKILSFAYGYLAWRRIHSTVKCFRGAVKKEKRKKINVLDVGCGRGRLTFKLKEAVGGDCDIHVSGIDTYKPAIDFANIRKEALNRDEYHFKLMDARDLKFKDDSFDIIICSEVIEHLKNPQLAIKEIYRVLKKGGSAIISTPNKREDALTKIVKVIFEKFFNYKKTELSGDIENECPALKQAVIHHISVKNHKEWTKIFKQCGFSLQAKIGTGGMLCNCEFLEEHRLLFGLMVIFDTLLENAPFSYFWSEIALFVLKK